MKAQAARLKPVILCSICCSATVAEGVPPIVLVRSSASRFRGKQFPVWRCRDCGSIHAAREVNLEGYHQDHAFQFPAPLDWRLRLRYWNQLRRLKAAGLKKDMRILDYGRSSSTFVEYLRQRGYQQSFELPQGASSFQSGSSFRLAFDFIVAEDVIEHTTNVVGFMRDITGLLVDGGTLVIGTRDASAIDLRTPDPFAHALRQPFNRKILSLRALLALARRNGLVLQRLQRGMYNYISVPFVNRRLVAHYARCLQDEGQEALLSSGSARRGPWGRFKALVRATFRSFVRSFLGSFFASQSSITTVFRRSALPGAHRIRA